METSAGEICVWCDKEKAVCGAIKKRLYQAFSTTADPFTAKNASVSC